MNRQFYHNCWSYSYVQTVDAISLIGQTYSNEPCIFFLNLD